MNLVNRTAIVVRPKQLFYAWARSLEEVSLIDSAERQELSEVYLVDDTDSLTPDQLVRQRYRVIFAAQLQSWHTAEEAWPQRRTWKLFQEWFDAEVVEMVFDLGRFRLEADSE